MTDFRARKPTILILAASNEGQSGVTGAAIGTETVVEMLRGDFGIEWIQLGTNGLAQLGASSSLAKLASALAAAFASLTAIVQLALRGFSGPQVDFVYFLPAASTMGTIRNGMISSVLRAFFPRARLLLHIRNGNYFEASDPWKIMLLRAVNRRAYRIFVLSHLLLPKDLARFGVQRDQICVLPNTIDESLVPASLPRRGVGPPLRVLYLSNFIESKGYLALLEAAEILAADGYSEHFTLDFYGEWLSDEARDTAERRASALRAKGMTANLHDSVRDRAKVQSLFATHHVFCLPTLYPAEAQPRSILEAMANGCVILATRYRSIPEQVEHGKTGLMVADQKPGPIANSLLELLQSDLEIMSMASREHFMKHFSRNHVREALLHELTSGRRGP